MYFLPATRRAVPTRFVRTGFDAAFDDVLNRVFRPVVSDADATRAPSLDVVETDTAYTVTLDVPGITRDQLKVSVEGKRVSIETQAATETEKKDGEKTIYRERSTRRYARSFGLPAEVDQNSSQAKLDNGVLTLTLTKKVQAGATQISIN